MVTNIIGYMVSVGTWLKFTSSSACFGLYGIVEQAKVMHKIDVRSAVEMQLFVSNPFSSSVVTKNISLLQS